VKLRQKLFIKFSLLKVFGGPGTFFQKGSWPPEGKWRMFMDQYMAAAIEEARLGLEEGGIPIGSVIVYEGRIIGRGHNRRVQQGSVILHGEMDTLENAGRQQAGVYSKCTLYTTLSPCPMCSGAIRLYGIPKVVIGENKSFMGDEEILKTSGVELVVLQEPACIQMMTEFIKNNPVLWDEDIGE
jgi:creatinine deaminase